MEKTPRFGALCRGRVTWWWISCNLEPLQFISWADRSSSSSRKAPAVPPWGGVQHTDGWSTVYHLPEHPDLMGAARFPVPCLLPIPLPVRGGQIPTSSSMGGGVSSVSSAPPPPAGDEGMWGQTSTELSPFGRIYSFEDEKKQFVFTAS